MFILQKKNKINKLEKNKVVYITEMTENCTVSCFLLRRLKELGCDHIFGVPGDFVLEFLCSVLKSKIEYVGTCNELNAAYAADGYARLKGIGAVCTTYNVGELSALNGVAGAFAESVPIVKISGIPSRSSLKNKPLYHHSIPSNFLVSASMYKEITVAQTILDNPETIAREIDRVLLKCLHQKAPVYIAIPSDIVHLTIPVPKEPLKATFVDVSHKPSLKDALVEITEMIQKASFPLLIPGLQINRRNLAKEFLQLAEAFHLPFCSMPMNKAVIDEDHDLFIGLSCGGLCRENLRQQMEKVDCLIIFGEILSDFNTGGFSSTFYRNNTIQVAYDQVTVKRHTYHNVFIQDILKGLKEILKSINYKNTATWVPGRETCIYKQNSNYNAKPQQALSVSRFLQRISQFIKPDSVVLAETGLSSFSVPEVKMPKNTSYISQVFYGSIGYSLGATLGVLCAAPDRPVILFIGDGSFQVVCQELSSIIRLRQKSSSSCTPIIFLLNNDGYTIERKICDGDFNDIHPWKYHELPQVFCAPKQCSAQVKTEEDLDQVLVQFDKRSQLPVLFVEVHLERNDCTRILELAGQACHQKNQGSDVIERYSAFIDEHE